MRDGLGRLPMRLNSTTRKIVMKIPNFLDKISGRRLMRECFPTVHYSCQWNLLPSVAAFSASR